MSIRRSPEVVDPLGALGAWTIAPVCALLAVAYAVFSTTRNLNQVSAPWLAALALLLVVVASAVLVWRALPRHAPFGFASHLAVVGLAVLADVTFVAAMWGRNRLIQDDWGQIAVALLLLALARRRPPLELAISGVVAGVIVGAVASTQWSFLATRSDPLLFAVVAATPVVALACGAAAYGHAIVAAAERWRGSAIEAMRRLEPEARETVARTVQQVQVTALNAGAIPLLTDILERDEITADHIARAASLASELRTRTVSALERSWLEDVLERSTIAETTLSDPHGLAAAMSFDQRAVVGAVASELFTRAGAAQGGVAHAGGARAGGTAQLGRIGRTGVLEVRIAPERSAPGRSVPERSVPGRSTPELAESEFSGSAVFELDVELGVAPRSLRAALVPYLSVLRVVTRDARLQLRQGRLRLEFRYDRS